MQFYGRHTVKALLSPRGAYLILGLKKGAGGGLIREGLNREGGAYFKSYIFEKIHFSKTEQEMGYVWPSYKCNVIYTLTQR